MKPGRPVYTWSPNQDSKGTYTEIRVEALQVANYGFLRRKPQW